MENAKLRFFLEEKAAWFSLLCYVITEPHLGWSPDGLALGSLTAVLLTVRFAILLKAHYVLIVPLPQCEKKKCQIYLEVGENNASQKS